MKRQTKESGFRIAGLALILVLSNPVASAADVDSEPLSGLTVEAAQLAALPGSDIWRIRLRLDNYGTRALTLTGVSSPRARYGVLVMRHPGLGYMEVGMLSVPLHETLDLDTSHLRVELRGLFRPLVPGETIPLRLEFLSGAVEIEAHVHSKGQGKPENSSQPQLDEAVSSLSVSYDATRRFVMNEIN